MIIENFFKKNRSGKYHNEFMKSFTLTPLYSSHIKYCIKYMKIQKIFYPN